MDAIKAIGLTLALVSFVLAIFAFMSIIVPIIVIVMIAVTIWALLDKNKDYGPPPGPL